MLAVGADLVKGNLLCCHDILQAGLPHSDCYAEQMSLLQLEIKRRTDEIEKKTKDVDLLNRRLERLSAASQGEENLGGC